VPAVQDGEVEECNLQNGAAVGWGAAIVAVLGIALGPASAAELSSPWVNGHNWRTRLVAGSLSKGGSTPQLFAGIEIRLNEGWKTYWRMPGDAGGIPPSFSWVGSTNLAAAKVLYPAPRRLQDATGDTVGYKSGVVFPVEVTPNDPAQPVELRLALAYGICREICVPAEATLSLSIPPQHKGDLPPAIAAALEAVPHTAGTHRETDPALLSARAALSGDRVRLVFEAAFPGGTAGADLFVEAPDGIFVSQPKRAGQVSEEVLRFEVDLAHGVNLEELKGKTLRLTMVSDAGMSETAWKVE
jgi:DsbC/DsbD-like thiol-disulfide interchange protein